MDRLGAEPNITVTYDCTPGGERPTSRVAHPVYFAMALFTLVTLSASAVLRGGEDAVVFAVMGAVGLLVALWRMLSWPSEVARATVTFTRLGMSIDQAGRRQSFSWSLVRSVGRPAGLWEFRLGSGPVHVVPESAFGADQAAALTELVRGKGLLHT